jgi:hypothetical protein
MLTSIVAATLFAQTGPLGDSVTIRPIEPSPQIQKALPPLAIVLSISNIDERTRIVVFDTGKPPLLQPHIALLDGEKLIWNEALSSRDDYLESYAFVRKQVTNCRGDNAVYIATFRNIGDGSGTAFVTVTRFSGKWRMSFVRRFQQAKLDLSDCGKVFSVKYASPRQECTWCAHSYEIQRFVLSHDLETYIPSGKPTGSGRLLPKSVMQ